MLFPSDSGNTLVHTAFHMAGTDIHYSHMLNDAFASSDPGGSTPDNTASDKEVDDLLNDVFGEQP